MDENGHGNGNGDEDEKGEEGGGEIKPDNLPSDRRGEAEDARKGVTPTSNKQPQSQDPTPQQDRRIMRRTKRRDGKRGTGSGRQKERTSTRNP